MQIPHAQASDLRMEVITAYNFVVDSNVESPSTNGPSAAHLGVKIYNDGDNPLTDVYVNIGDLTTPGTFPSRTVTVSGANGYSGTFALQMPGGATDAVRYIPSIPAHSYVAQYFFVTYPLKDPAGNSVAGAAPDPTDDLYLNYSIWVNATDASTPLSVNNTTKVTMRNEISAMANKIWPNTDGKVPDDYLNAIEAQLGWRPDIATPRIPGAVVMEGIWYDLGNVGAGFDNNGDGIPDRNAWLQPAGDPTKFSSLGARLVKCYGLVIVKLNDGTEQLIPFEDRLYFENIPGNNRGAVGLVYYEFIPLDTSKPTQLSPYQEVASGYDNEKFNGDYGASVGSVAGTPPNVVFDKDGPATIAGGSNATYILSATSYETLGSNRNFGWPELALPLVFQDTIPSGLVYVAGSATTAANTPSGAFTVNWSTDGGTTWVTTEPAAASVRAIRWIMSGTLAPGQTATVQFQANVPTSYPTTAVSNTGCLKKGTEENFACDTTTTLVSGINSIGDFVWQDLNRNGSPDDGATGIADVTVSLYVDSNGNGSLDTGEPLYTSTSTNASGAYLFSELPDRNYIVVVDSVDPQLPYGFTLKQGVSDRFAVNLDSGSTNPDPVDFLTADWPFIQALEVTKTVSPTTYKQGEWVTYNIDLANHSSTVTGNVSPSQIAYAKVVTGTAGAVITPGNAAGAPNGFSALMSWSANADVMTSAASGSTALDFPSPSGTISSVSLVLRCMVSRTFANSPTLTVTLAGYTGITSPPVIAKAALNNLVGQYQDLVIPLTTVPAGGWNWTELAKLTVALKATKSGGSGEDVIMNVDSIGVRVVGTATTGTYGPSTISPLPLTDTYDSTKLEFISASVAPTSQSTATPTAATLYWSDLGVLNAGTRKTLTVTFRAIAPTTSPPTTRNTAAASNAWFVSGRPTNNASSYVDIAVTAAGSIGDTVFWDLGTQGTYDGPTVDIGIPGVVVSLYAGTTLLATTSTDSNGKYLFEGLSDATNYNVRVLTSSVPLSSPTVTYDPNGSPYSAVGPDVSISGSNSNMSQDFGFSSSSGLISGTIFYDLNGNGVRDLNESPIPGLTVTLTGGATRITDANGYYLFAGLSLPTSPTVTVTPPTGSYRQTLDPDLTPGTLGGDNKTSTALTTSNRYDINNDFAYQPTGTGSIGNLVWLDTNNNGVKDTAESGIDGVTVLLYRSAATPGTSTPYATTTTSGGGSYSFSSLPEDNYVVYLPASNFTTGNALAGTPLSSTTTVSSDNQVNNDDNGIQSTTGAAVTSPIIALAAAESDQTVDFGFTGTGAIGNLVWFDANNNGIKDSGESGINGVAVQLYLSSQTPGVDTPVATTTTAGGGIYGFSGLTPANYVVYIPATNFTGVGALVATPLSSTTTVSIDNTVDNDDNGIQTASGLPVISPVITLSAAATDTTKDFGFTGVGSVGDFVFYDLNGNGQQDFNELGIANVTVNIFLDNTGGVGGTPDGVPDSPTPVATAVTADGTDPDYPAGFYRFDNLAPGTYFVQVDTGSPSLAGLTYTSDPDRDGVPVGSLPALPAGDYADSYVAVSSGSNYSGADFGYQPPGSIGDFVWLDLNQDGVQDSGEPGIANVTVHITNGTTPYDVTTDANGYWGIALPNGDWTVSIPAANFSAGGALENRAPTYDADGLTIPNSTAVTIANGNVTVPAGLAQGNLGIDFGYKLSGVYSLAGTVAIHDTGAPGVADDVDDFYDDGVDMDAGLLDETELSGVEVFLYYAGKFVGSTYTDSNGDYSFSGLASGPYNVIIGTTAAPLNHSVLTTTTANNISNSTVSNTATSVTQQLTITSNVTHVDFMFNSTVDYDYGDLPASYGMTTLAQDGARHIIPSGGSTVYLGTAPDADVNGMPTAAANGDDNTGSDDENGVVINTSSWTNVTTSGAAQVTVVGSGWLVGWIDWNNDGDFLDADELIISQAVSTGTPTINFSIPAGTITSGSQSWLSRFRVFTAAPAVPGFSYEGEATNGEVEDQLLEKTVGGSISDLVWNDANNSGTYNAGEDGLGGITVVLRNGSNTIVGTQVTGTGTTDVDSDGTIDPLGYYRFTGLAAGTYTVTVSTPPAYFNPSYDENGTGTQNVTTVVLTTGVQHLTADFGYAPMVANISGQVRYDANANGNPNDADSAATAVKIQLWTDPNGDGNPADGEQVMETYTDGSGNYIFTAVPTGNYVVVEINPAGTTSTYDVSAPNDDRIPVTMVGANITGQDFLDTLPPVYAISGTVYADNNVTNNDVIDGGDTTIASVSVSLYFDRDANGVVSAGDSLITSTVTNSSGAYSFPGLTAGNYVVEETNPAGTTSVWDAADPLNDNQIGVTLVSANITTRDFLDAGYLVNLAGNVYDDANGLTDNTVNGTGTNAGGTLYANLVDGSNNVVQAVAVAEDGSYTFGTVIPNTSYTIVLSTTQGTPGNTAHAAALPSGWVNTGENLGAGTGSDGTVDGILAVAVTTSSVTNANFGIEQPPTANDATASSQLNPGGTNEVVVTTLSGTDPEDVSPTTFTIKTLPTHGTLYYNGTGVTLGQVITSYSPSLLTVDPSDGSITVTFTYSVTDAAGRESSPATVTMPFTAIDLAGNVYADANGLTDGTVNGTATNAGDTLYANLVSGGNVAQVVAVAGDGSYTFGTVAPNTSYSVVLSTTQGTVGAPAPAAALPAGYVNTGENLGAGAGSDGTPDGVLAVAVAGSSVSNANFGIMPAAISGYVKAGTTPLPGVRLTLYDSFGNPVDGNPSMDGVQFVTAVTDSNGFYIFSGVAPGSYQVRQLLQPSGHSSFGDRDGGNLNIVGDVTLIVVESGQTNADNNFLETSNCPCDWATWISQRPGQGASDNPDGDAYDNLAEFAFAMPSNSGAGNAWLIQPSTSELYPGILEGVFVRAVDATLNATYTLQYAETLGTTTVWQSIDIAPLITSGQVTTVSDGCYETVTIHNLEILTGSKPFVRIQVDLDEDPGTGIDHTSYTEVEGWKETALGTETPLVSFCRTYNNPFLRETAFTGTISAVDGQTLTFATSAGEVDLSTLLAAGASFYLEVTAGSNEGHRFDVTAALGNTLTLAGDTSLCPGTPPFSTLTTVPPSLVGNRVVLRRHWTLGEMFPVDGFTASNDPELADQVQTYADGTWVTYWLDSSIAPARWVTFTDSGDQAATVLPPGQGMFVLKRATKATLFAYGEVRANDFVRPLCAGSNLVGGGFPIDQSATGTGSRAMTLAVSPASGFFGSRDLRTADTFYVWKRDTVTSASGYDSYYLLNRDTVVPAQIKWVKVGDVKLTARDAEPLLSSEGSVFIRMKNDLHSYTIPCPWNP